MFARMIRLISLLAAALSALALPSAAGARSLVLHSAGQDASPVVLELAWADLLPPGELQRIAELQQMQALTTGIDHFGVEAMPQLQTFNVVEALDGRRVRLGGYVLPFDFNAERQVRRFLLVPYVGACIHVPPPPPNQLVYVTTDAPVAIDGLWDPVFAEGVLRTRRHDNELGDTAYTLELTRLRPYTN